MDNPAAFSTCKMHKSSLAARVIVLKIIVLLFLALGDYARAQPVRWHDTGRMRLGHSGHTATLLDDGSVLIVGGCIDGYCSPATVNAELYEPASGAWTNTGPMRFARYYHTATLLNDGRVLVVGRSASAEMFDPVTGTWTATGNVRVVRFNHTATLLNDGRVLVTGGCIQEYCGLATATAELYDPAIPAWTSTGTMRLRRYNHTETLLPDGKVLVVGGGGGASASATAEVYDPETGTWTDAGRMRIGRSNHSATLLTDGNVLIAGGCPQANCNYYPTATAELFDSSMMTWRDTGDMRDGRSFHTATLLTNGNVVVSGSWIFGGEGNWPQLNTAEEYDPAEGTWTSRTFMRSGRSSHSATLLNDGRVLVAGGIDFLSCQLECTDLACYLSCLSSVTGAAEIYDPSIELPLSIITTALPNGTVDSVYSFRVRSSDGHLPISWDLSVGALPAGLVLNPDTGQISGIPTTAGMLGFTMRATDSSSPPRTATQPLNISVRPVLSIGTTALQSGAAHCSYTASLQSSGGTPPITWSISSGALAVGLVLNSATGQISGTPAAPGTFNFTVQATDTSSPPQTPTQPLSIVVDETTRVACWGDTGRMSGERARHTAILLPDGRIFVTGTPAPGAELYDPATGIWTRTSEMGVRRSGHTATLLQDGKVLVAGGAGATSELYDPATGVWIPTGSMNSGRDSHAATLLHDGRVLVSGGSFNSSAELYDPSTGTWAPTGSMGIWRVNHTATLLDDGKVLVLGTAWGEFPAELYDPSTGTWTWTSGQGRAAFHSATLLPDGRLLVVGGCCGYPTPRSAELYDPATGIWTATGSTRIGHRLHTATLLADGNVLVAGGDPNLGWLGETAAELYDPATGAWTDTASLVTGRWIHTATLLSDGRVLVAGGAVQGGSPFIETVYTAASEVYLPAP